MARRRAAFLALSPHDRGLVAEAALLVILLRVGLRTMPFVTLRRMLSRYGSRGRAHGGVQPRETSSRIVWSVTAAARHLPLRTTCLIEALAADAMLRRRGFVSTLRIGVREPAAARPLDAHAWLECGGSVVLGELPNLSEYVVFSGRKDA